MTIFKLAALSFFIGLAVGCGGGAPELGAAMTEGEVYEVNANDRLVNASLEPASIRVVLQLDEDSGTTRAELTLLEGSADLFR